jgi:hypothetical protein
MNAAFASLVDLCRLADMPRIVGTDLVFNAKRSAKTVALLESIEAGGWACTLAVAGVETTQPLNRLAEGTAFELTVHGMTRMQQVIANNVGALLRLNQGAFLGQPPAEFYLIDEDHASWEPARHTDVLAYLRALKVVALLRRLADVVRERADSAGEAIILATRKLAIPMVYDSRVLAHVAEQADIDSFDTDVFNEHHKDARRDIAKRVLVRFFDAVPETERFSDFLRRLPEVRQTFLADFDVYASGFSFDKVREEFERKKLDFIVKTTTASSDVMNKLIAIPVGQGLLVSQMKREASLAIVNWALLIGSLVFAIIALVLIANQVITLRHIREELRAEKNILRERAAPSFDRLKGMIASLERRLNLHISALPAALILLLIATTTMTCIVFAQLTASLPN